MPRITPIDNDCFKNLQGINEIKKFQIWFVGGIGFLLLLSLFLALCRVYQVDEAEYAFTARIIALNQIDKYFVSAPLFLFPFLRLIRSARESCDVFDILRLGFCGIFWINIFLLIKASGQKLRSWMLPLCLVLVLPHGPLWTYGLEVRHENLLLMGLLLSWILVRSKILSLSWIFMGLGLVAVLTQACAVKSIVYWIPLNGLLLIFPPRRPTMKFWWRSIYWFIGFFIGIVVLCFVHSFTGTWNTWWKANVEMIKAITILIATRIGMREAITSIGSFPPWESLHRLFLQMPIPLAVSVAVLISTISSIIRTGRIVVTWESKIPELLVWLGSIGLLMINPNPFPYNILIPSAMMLIIFLPVALELMKKSSQTIILIALIWLFVQGGGFVQQIKTLIQSGNNRQIALMRAAEELTDSGSHRVFDAAGLTPTRLSVGPVWIVNILNVSAIQAGLIPPIYKELMECPPAVIIPTYRFGYLGDKEFHFFKENYVSLAEDFWVLGQKSKKEMLQWNCLVGGRYILINQGSLKTNEFQVNGEDMPIGIHTFLPGIYIIKGDMESRPFVAWLGPTRLTLPNLNMAGMRPGVFPIPGGF